jgi:two-component system, OmpR family, sensor histidine kinase KdpD
MASSSSAPDGRDAAAAVAAVALLTLAYRWLSIANATTTALSYLLIVLIVAATSRLRIAVLTSCLAMLCFNFFFLPPVGRLTIADPQNWVALIVFLTVSLVASRLSSIAREQAREAAARRDELARLFDLSRDVLLMNETFEALRVLARFIARRFDLDYAAICLPRDGRWEVFHAGAFEVALDEAQLTKTYEGVQKTLEFDAQARTYAGHAHMTVGARTLQLVPLRVGVKTIGLFAASGRTVEPGTLDALAGLVAIAIERTQLLEDRKAAEISRKSEELKSALLASLGHDLRTPLTAIRVAASNLQASWLADADRREQTDVVVTEVDRLSRLFEDILDMARIDAGAVSTELQWVHPSQIVDAARENVGRALAQHRLAITAASDVLVRLDPRLTTAALAQLLENAVRYSPDGSVIEVSTRVTDSELVIAVRDRGRGIAPEDLPRLFDRFYRGAPARGTTGSGMGLSIARGLLAVEHGRVWAENCSDGGAQFTIAVPVESRTLEPQP